MPDESYSKIYRKCKKLPGEAERSALEYEAGMSALQKLNPDDQEVIRRQVRELTVPGKIRNFGEKAAYHMLQRLGVFFKENGVTTGRSREGRNSEE